MNNILLLLLLLLIIVISFIFFFYQTENVNKIKTNKIKIRCPPTEIKNIIEVPSNICKKNNKDIEIYGEDICHIKNKGFVNELIYKPNVSSIYIDDYFNENNNQDNISLNDPSYIISQNIPIGNINVNYLLKYNTSKLSI